MSAIKCAVVGLGYWGPNLVRNIAANSKLELAALCDRDAAKLDKMRGQFGTARLTTNYQEILDDPAIAAVAVATPVGTHFDLAKRALEAGKHVLVEKPMTDTIARAEHLVKEAEARRLTLMVDHTFIYTGAVAKIRELIDNQVLGDIYYYDSVRVNLGLFQHDINVLWDLAVHDLSIMDYVLGQEPKSISAFTQAHIKDQTDNIAYVTCRYPGNLVAHINVNWMAPVKVRQTMIGGSKKMVVYDDVEPSEKVKIYSKSVFVDDADPYHLQVNYRIGDMTAPMLDNTEALKKVTQEFATSIEKGTKPMTDGMCGLRVVRLLEMADKSAKLDGALVAI